MWIVPKRRTYTPAGSCMTTMVAVNIYHAIYGLLAVFQMHRGSESLQGIKIPLEAALPSSFISVPDVESAVFSYAVITAVSLSQFWSNYTICAVFS